MIENITVGSLLGYNFDGTPRTVADVQAIASAKYGV